MPFYSTLLKRSIETGQKGRLQLAVVSMEPVETSRIYLEQHGLEIPTVTAVKRGDLKVSGTPTLLLVDRSGAVQRIWRGKLSPPQENEVLEAALGTSTAQLLKR
jgi:hypothetical protein